MYYFGKRYYDPAIGRWLSCDPAEQGWSPYVYCSGNPVNMVDPDGEFVIEALVIAYRLYQIYSLANMAYQMYDAYQHGGFGAMMNAGMQIGAPYFIGSAVGGVMGGYGGGLLRDMAVGGVSGAVTGGTVSAMFGGSFKDGAISGGIVGALSAGIGYYGNKALEKVNSMDIEETGKGDVQKTEKGTLYYGKDEAPEGLPYAEYSYETVLGGECVVTSEYLSPTRDRHLGTDFRRVDGSKWGDPVFSGVEGVVTRYRANGKFGGRENNVYVDAGNGLTVSYHHVKPTTNIRAGARLSTYTPIGSISKTGHFIGTPSPHVHIQPSFHGILFNSKYIFKR